MRAKTLASTNSSASIHVHPARSARTRTATPPGVKLLAEVRDEAIAWSRVTSRSSSSHGRRHSRSLPTAAS